MNLQQEWPQQPRSNLNQLNLDKPPSGIFYASHQPPEPMEAKEFKPMAYHDWDSTTLKVSKS